MAKYDFCFTLNRKIIFLWLTIFGICMINLCGYPIACNFIYLLGNILNLISSVGYKLKPINGRCCVVFLRIFR